MLNIILFCPRSAQGSFDLPSVDLQSIVMPKMDLDSIQLPEMPAMPKITMPAIDMPNMPSIDLQSMGLPAQDLELPVVVIGLAVLIATFIAVGNSGGTGDVQGATSSSSPVAKQSKKKPKKGGKADQLAIPYDAASRLAYDAWCTANDETFNEGGYAHFRDVFNAKSVADATAKKLARDLAEFKNEAPSPPPPRKIAPPKPTTPKKVTNGEESLFFAQPLP